MRNTISLFIIFFLTTCLCNGQTNQIEGCYFWKSDYYGGDYQKICFNKDSTFYYQSHQNDVRPDSYSIGIWQSNIDTIKLKSIEPFISDSQIVQRGNPFKDTLYIKFVDFNTGVALPHVTFEFYDSNMKMLSTRIADSNGTKKIKFNTNFKYIRSRKYFDYEPILLDVNSLNYEQLVIKMNDDNHQLIYEDISNMKLLIKSKKKLVVKYGDNTIDFYKQK